jgi:hypothetical protein
LPQVRVPQHWEELLHAVPCDEQDPFEQTDPLHVSVPQHCEDEEHDPPLLVHALDPVQTPLVQLMLPQQSTLCAQRVPAAWQDPPPQTLLALHVRVPQQSPLLPQTWLLDWHGPVCGPPGMVFTSTPFGHAQSASAEQSRTDQARTRDRGGMERV